MQKESAKIDKNPKRIRSDKGIIQGDIVRKLGVSRSFVRNIENGNTNPILPIITKLAMAVGVSVDKFLK